MGRFLGFVWEGGVEGMDGKRGVGDRERFVTKGTRMEEYKVCGKGI